MSVPYLLNAKQWIFLYADEPAYSFFAKEFLRTGSWGWAGWKPGSVVIVAIAQALLGDSATTALYVEALFGALLVFVIFRLARYYIPSPPAIIAALAVSSSLFFQYYTKTHIIFSSFWFALGILFYIRSIESQKPAKTLFLSGLSMGAGLSCYYNLAIYIPAMLFPEIALWHQSGRSQFRARGLYLVCGAALVPFCFDLYALVYWLITRRFTQPVSMALFSQFRINNLSGFGYPWDRFISQFIGVEGKAIAILFLIGLAILFHRAVRFRKVTDILLLSMIVPPLLLQARAWMGQLSVQRTFFSAFPFIILVAFVPLGVAWHQISESLQHSRGKHVLHALIALGLLWCSWRAYAAFQTLATVSTGYEQVDRFLQQTQTEKVAYRGSQFAWRFYFSARTALELNTEGQPDKLRQGGPYLAEALRDYQWVVVNQAGLRDLSWIDENLSEAGFALYTAFESNEFDFSLVRQESYGDDYETYDVLNEIRLYRNLHQP